MRITKFKSTKLKKYMFVNECVGTRNGFKHISKLFYNDYKIIENTAHYINRTWECYTFQTSMCGAVYTLIENRKETLKRDYKEKNNIKRLTEKTKKELEKIYDSDEKIKTYKLMYKELKNYYGGF